MAKKRASTLQKSASTSSTTTPTPTCPPKSTQGGMVLRVRTSEQMKKITAKLNEPMSRKKPKSTSSKKKTSRIDAFKPKKPPTAFFYFLEDFRKEFQEKNPDIKSMRDIGKACGDKWKTMNYEEKVHYYDIATEKRAEFDKAMADYNKRKETGEFQEYEEDSDFEN